MEELDFRPIVARLKWLIKNDPRTQAEFCQYLGKTRQIIYDWENKHHPTLMSLYKASKYFGVPREYILSGEESPIDDATAAFIVQTQGLTEEQKKIVFASMKAQIDVFKKMNENNIVDN